MSNLKRHPCKERRNPKVLMNKKFPKICNWFKIKGLFVKMARPETGRCLSCQEADSLVRCLQVAGVQVAVSAAHLQGGVP